MRAEHATDRDASRSRRERRGVRLRRSASGRLIVALDLAVLLWVAAWAAMGIAVARDVSNLSEMADTVVAAGHAVGETGRVLRGIERVPFVGDLVRSRVGQALDQIDAAGRQAVASGTRSRQSVRSLSVELGVSVALIPSIPFLVAYVPFRISRTREARAVRRAAARHGSEPAFEEFLARRAVERLPFHRLREVSENPWRDLERGDHGALADAELRRLGMRRDPRRTTGWD